MTALYVHYTRKTRESKSLTDFSPSAPAAAGLFRRRNRAAGESLF